MGETFRNYVSVEGNVAEPWTGCFVPDDQQRSGSRPSADRAASTAKEESDNTVFHQCVIYHMVVSTSSIYYATKLYLRTLTRQSVRLQSALHVQSDTAVLGRAALVICLRGSRGMIRGVIGVALHWAESRGLYRVRVRRSS